MPETQYADQFLEGTSATELPSRRLEVRRRIEQLADFLEIGSHSLPGSIAKFYGPDVRKLVVKPFIVFYRFVANGGVVDVLGLVHQCTAW
ncbi:MAG: type II toxin-antitoxin system RelE/ParE family toxin [Eggerthellaceae bacterium]|nr:type II toxin-antitoxin system RelE/ParE family toxin [Eggerthellaceae bacterium]